MITSAFRCLLFSLITGVLGLFEFFFKGGGSYIFYLRFAVWVLITVKCPFVSSELFSCKLYYKFSFLYSLYKHIFSWKGLHRSRFCLKIRWDWKDEIKRKLYEQFNPLLKVGVKSHDIRLKKGQTYCIPAVIIDCLYFRSNKKDYRSLRNIKHGKKYKEGQYLGYENRIIRIFESGGGDHNISKKFKDLVSKCICGFLNNSLKGTLYLGVNHKGKYILFMYFFL